MAKHQRRNISTKLLVTWISHHLPNHHNMPVFWTWPCGQPWKCKAQEKVFLWIQPRKHMDRSRTVHQAVVLPQKYCYSTHIHISPFPAVFRPLAFSALSLMRNWPNCHKLDFPLLLKITDGLFISRSSSCGFKCVILRVRAKKAISDYSPGRFQKWT